MINNKKNFSFNLWLLYNLRQLIIINESNLTTLLALSLCLHRGDSSSRSVHRHHRHHQIFHRKGRNHTPVEPKQDTKPVIEKVKEETK